MSGLIYPGIWGCLQPNVPQVDWVTSALFPILVPDNLVLPQPQITNDSLLRTTAYNPTPKDGLAWTKPTFTAASSMVVTIAYKTINAPESITWTKPTFTPASAMITTIAYQTINESEAMSWTKPTFTPASSLVVTINYVNTTESEALRWTKPTFTAASSMFVA